MSLLSIGVRADALGWDIYLTKEALI